MLKRSLRWLIVGLMLVALVGAAGCDKKEETKETPEESTQPQEEPQTPAEEATPSVSFPVEDVTKLEIEDVVVGTGAEAVAGKTVTVHYTGWLTDGAEFDSSVGGQPYQFPLGAGQVIQGWDQGVAGMKIGGKRVLTIPPDLGYGAGGYPPAIPPNATLVFEVELLAVQ